MLRRCKVGERRICADEYEVSVPATFEHRRIRDAGDVRKDLCHPFELGPSAPEIGVIAAVGYVKPSWRKAAVAVAEKLDGC